MKKSRFTEEQIIAAMKKHERGIAAAEICRLTLRGTDSVNLGPEYDDCIQFDCLRSIVAMSDKPVHYHYITWRTEPPMPHPRHGLGAATIGAFIHVPAGAGVQGCAGFRHLRRA